MSAPPGSIRGAVIDEHEIFRRGVVACLHEEPGIRVVAAGAQGPIDVPLDVAVVSPRAAAGEALDCPVVVCAPTLTPPPTRNAPNAISGVLPRATLTCPQLLGAVRAAAAGLAVRIEHAGARVRLDARSLDVLRLLAEGATTGQISETLRYSSHTIKSVISGIERTLHVRTRAQAVAVGIRGGLI